LPASDWTRYSTRAGEKGLIWYDWLRLRVATDNDEIGEQWLLVRRHLHAPEDYDFFLSNAPHTCSLEVLVMVASARHHIEEALEECKGQAGLADYEVRFWHSWYRHITLSMLAYTLLTLLRFEQHPGEKNALRQLAHLQSC
jgi:SRSO17 transposase